MGVYHGKVESVLVASQHDSIQSEPRDCIKLVHQHGVVGDRKAGPRLLDEHEDVLLRFGLPKGIQIANFREFTAVSKDELEAVAKAVGMMHELPYGFLGENLVISGIRNFSRLPSGTVLTFRDGTFARTTVLVAWRQNAPTIEPGEAIRRRYPHVRAEDFVPAAKGLAGIVGAVYCSGVICAGDKVIAITPSGLDVAAESEEEEEH